jgi:hypothetical protein
MPTAIGIAVLSACFASGCPAKEKPAPTPPPSTSAAAPSSEHIDADRMLATVADLASDDLGGRYSLHEGDIGRAASLLAAQLRDAGVAPVGDDYRHPYSILVGATPSGTPVLDVTRRNRTRAVEATDFTPLSVSASGSVEGEVVFVGYGVQEAAEGERRGYDDLGGVELEGKIALMLLDAPRRPDARALYRALADVRDTFETKAEPLREASDTAALAKLHEQSRAKLAALVRPFVGRNAIAPEHLEAPDDPTQALALDPFTEPVFGGPADPKAPRFGYRSGRLRDKLERLHAAGAVAAIVVRGPRSHVGDHEREADELPVLEQGQPASASLLPVVQMRWREADRAFRIGRRRLSAMQAKIDAALAPMSGPTGATAKIEVELVPQMRAVPNVVGMIRGSKKPKEIVVIGAHFDHIGTDEEGHGHCRAVGEAKNRDAICNGADDNASGTAVVLEVARVLAQRPPPKRTLVFALFSGEEIGLYGSRALADAPPNVEPFAGGKVVAMVNIDMVGRLGDQGLAVGGVGSSPAWMKMFDEIGTLGIPTVYDRSVTSRSDHANFYRHDIPVVFFFTGVHADYHRPGDEVAQINRDGLATIGELTLGLVERLGDGRKIPFAKPANPAEGLVRALPGDNADTVERRVGFPDAGGGSSSAALH